MYDGGNVKDQHGDQQPRQDMVRGLERLEQVGIARHQDAFGFKAVKNEAKIIPSSVKAGAKKKPLKSIKKVPVIIETVTNDIKA